MVKAFGIDVKEVRRIANRMGIPKDVPLPYVTVKDIDVAKHGCAYLAPIHQKDKKEYPAGYVIELSPKELTSIAKDGYILGGEARDDIKHELHHYMQARKNPALWKRMGVDTQIAEELAAGLESGATKTPPSLHIARQVFSIAEERRLPVEVTLEKAKIIARKMGVSEGVLSRAERILIEKGKIKKTATSKGAKSLTSSIKQSKEKSSQMHTAEVAVRQHRRSTPSGRVTSVRRHQRHVLKRH